MCGAIFSRPKPPPAPKPQIMGEREDTDPPILKLQGEQDGKASGDAGGSSAAEPMDSTSTALSIPKKKMSSVVSV